jgi:ligand-binding sensor domain-containing protein
MWFRTLDGGVSRYDGKTFVNFTTKDGLAGNNVVSIHRDADGALWFGTTYAGVSRYDGKTFTTLTTKDGLANNAVIAIYQDPDGAGS